MKAISKVIITLLAIAVITCIGGHKVYARGFSHSSTHTVSHSITHSFTRKISSSKRITVSKSRTYRTQIFHRTSNNVIVHEYHSYYPSWHCHWHWHYWPATHFATGTGTYVGNITYITISIVIIMILIGICIIIF